MSKYINDPRERAILPESGVTYEEDNRVEKMYHWGAKVLDLCDMEVSEYMKPMTVIIGDYTPESGSTGTTKVNVSIKVSVISPEGNILDKDGVVIGATQGDGTWKVRWTWNKDFNSILASSVAVTDSNSNEIVVNSNIESNQSKEYTTVIDGIGNNSVTSIGTCTIGTSQSTATGSTVVVDDKISRKEYDIKIEPTSGEEPVLDGDIYYAFIPKSSQSTFNTMDSTTALNAKGEGAEFKFYTEASAEYIAEAEKFDNGSSPYDGDDAEELWDEFVTAYENANRYVLRMYIPKELEDVYNYNLYNDNAGILVPATLTKTGVEKSHNGVTYSEYVNENDSYLYDDVDNREFTLRFIISEK